jgi:WD40 repeat protein
MKTALAVTLLFIGHGVARADWGDGDPSATLSAKTAGLSQDGKTALVAYEGHFWGRHRRLFWFLKLWNVERQTVTWSSFENTESCVFVSFLPGTQTVFVAMASGEIRQLDVASGKLIGTIKAFEVSFTQDANRITVSKDGKWILAEGIDNPKRALFKLIDLERGREIREFPRDNLPVGNVPTHVEISPDKTLALFTTWGGHHESWVMVVMDLDFGKVVASFDAKGGWKPPAAFCPDGTIALWKPGPKENSEILFWDLAKQAVVRRFPIGDAMRWELLPKGTSVRTIHGQGEGRIASVRTWDLVTGKQLNARPRHEDELGGHFWALTPDRKRALVLSGGWARADRVISNMRLGVRDRETDKLLVSWFDPSGADELPPEPPLFLTEESVNPWRAVAGRSILAFVVLLSALVALRIRSRARLASSKDLA